jgi:pimeloyl-ACP methyl ester carboxylesterase
LPYLSRDTAKIYFDDQGDGPAILTSHGVCENGSYWSLSGVTEGLVEEGFRVVDVDMRGHGRSVPRGAAPGYDVDTVASDFGAVADHLGLAKFHLLTHATGGMAGLRYAIDHSERLLSLMSTDTGSATVPSDMFCAPEYDEHVYEKIDPSGNPMAAAWEQMSASEMIRAAREGDGGPFLNRLNANADPDRCWQVVEEVLATGNPVYYAAFQRSFYDDPDPKVSGLRGIRCPCLVLLGEHDVLFVKPSELLARCIPNVKHVVLPGLGHMTAIEDPARTTEELLTFLRGLDAA